MSSSKTVFVVGGDGFCGWPLSLRLSKLGHNVVVVDNLHHREVVDPECGESLTPLASIEERLRVWNEEVEVELLNSKEDVSNNNNNAVSSSRDDGDSSSGASRASTEVEASSSKKPIVFHKVDVAKDAPAFDALIVKYKPDAIVHMAEIRAAPYSMIDAAHARETVDNNCSATHNIVSSIAHNHPTCHLVHLGTMGVYGYGAVKGTTIPEGYVEVVWAGKTITIPHPFYPGSVYHTTKTQDALMLQFYAKNYRIRVTDLHQGIVWGCQTDETMLHPALVNRLDYDGEYGTVLNRFCTQAAFGMPLSVYGSGGQTRGLIHIRDSVACVVHAISTPPDAPADGSQFWPRVINQITQTETVANLAKLVQTVVGADCIIGSVDNPRKELRDNDLVVDNATVRSWGVESATLLSEKAVKEIIDTASAYRSRFNPNQVESRAKW